MSRLSRIHAIKSGNGANGNVTNSPKADANLRAWANKASRNSFHGPSSEESATDRLGTKDLNHGGGSYLPKVRRDG